MYKDRFRTYTSCDENKESVHVRTCSFTLTLQLRCSDKRVKAEQTDGMQFRRREEGNNNNNNNNNNKFDGNK